MSKSFWPHANDAQNTSHQAHRTRANKYYQSLHVTCLGNVSTNANILKATPLMLAFEPLWICANAATTTFGAMHWTDAAFLNTSSMQMLLPQTLTAKISLMLWISTLAFAVAFASTLPFEFTCKCVNFPLKRRQPN